MIAEPGGLLVESLGREVLGSILDDQIVETGHQPESMKPDNKERSPPLFNVSNSQ
jgi:hypothetical protein